VEILFAKTWCTVPRDGLRFSINCLSCEKQHALYHSILPKFVYNTPENTVFSGILQGGCYANVDSLVQELSRTVIDGLTGHDFTTPDSTGRPTPYKLPRDLYPRITYNTLKKKVLITVYPYTTITLEPLLASMLGYGNTELKSSVRCGFQYFYGNFSADLDAAVHALYIYADVVEPIPVGDTEAPLLRIIDASGHSGDVIHRIYNPPRYLPVSRRSFDSIEIDIRTDEGEPVPFESGRLSTTLHFRRVLEPIFAQSI